MTSDQLSILTDATVSVSKGNVFVGGVKVGTILAGHTGSNGSDLTLNLLKGATASAVSILLNHVAYANSSADSLTRTVQFSIVDNDGTLHGGSDTGIATATINIVVPNHEPTGSVTISGTPTEDDTLMASNNLTDADGLGAITYHWLRGGINTGATGSTYQLGDADVGAEISVRASYTDGYGTAEAVTSVATTAVANINDAPTGSVTISGTPTEDQTLAASNNLTDADGLGFITYHWLRGGADTGITGSTYLLSDADVGAEIRVRADYIDGHGTAEAVISAATTILPDGLLQLGGHYYQIIYDPFVSHAEAEAAALASSFTLGATTWRGHLANVTSGSEEDLIENQILADNGGAYFSTLSSGFWLGGEFKGAEWFWKYGAENGEAFTYTDWGGAESAQGAAEPYLVLNMFARSDINGVWYSYDAGDTDLIKGYVVEYVPNALPIGIPTVTAEISSVSNVRPLSEADIQNSATQFWSSDNGHIYEFVNSPTLWQTAVALSESSTLSGVSGYLATVTTAEEQAFLESHFPADMWLSWLGATDLANEGQWVWQTGPEAGQALAYTNWDDAVASGTYGPQPDGGTGENYLAMGGATVSAYYGVDTAFKWVDGPSISAGQGVGYITEYSGVVETTPVQAVTLTADMTSISDADGLGSFNFQWQSSQDGNVWTDVAGATLASYQSITTDLASFYRLEASFIDGAGLLEVVHSQSYTSAEWLI